jgi:hypothetical protein
MRVSLLLPGFILICFGNYCIAFVLSPECWRSRLAVQTVRVGLGQVSVSTSARIFAIGNLNSKHCWKQQKRKEPLSQLLMSNVQGIAKQVNCRVEYVVFGGAHRLSLIRITFPPFSLSG